MLMRRTSSGRKTGATDMRGPKALRSTLVTGSNAKVEFADLDPQELLGQGAYGMVHRVTERLTGQSRVMKTVVRPDGWDDERLKLEAELLQNLDHPHILRIFSWYEEGDAVNIVMEHCEGGEVLKAVQDGRKRGDACPETWLATIVRQTFEALVYIHAKGIVHKDLKGQNLLLLHSTADEEGLMFAKPPHVIVCDLGIAEVCCRGIFGMRGKKVAGTPATMAPEVWKGSCGPKSDAWSMGCVMYELFTNRMPFEVNGNIRVAHTQQDTWLAMHKKGPNWDAMRASPEALSLCKQLLTFKESQRPSALEVLKHPWFTISHGGGMDQAEAEALCKAVIQWKDRSPTQRALCLKMASGCTCISKFSRLFSKFDTDNSGVLDRSELVAALKSIGIETTHAKKVAAALDINNDDSCEYLEFAAACLSSLEQEFDELLRQEFRALDISGRGGLTDRELNPFMEELSALAQSRGLEIQDIDENNDGMISFSEFCAYFGRPGVVYRDDSVQAPRQTPSRSLIPMKQHIRLVNKTGESIEQSMEFIRETMDKKSKKSRDADAPGNPNVADLGSSPTKSSPSRPSKMLRQPSHISEGDEDAARANSKLAATDASRANSKLAATDAAESPEAVRRHKERQSTPGSAKKPRRIREGSPKQGDASLQDSAPPLESSPDERELFSPKCSEDFAELDGDWVTSHKHYVSVKDGVCSFRKGPSFKMKPKSGDVTMNGWKLTFKSETTLRWQKADVELEWWREGTTALTEKSMEAPAEDAPAETPASPASDVGLDELTIGEPSRDDSPEEDPEDPMGPIHKPHQMFFDNSEKILLISPGQTYASMTYEQEDRACCLGPGSLLCRAYNGSPKNGPAAPEGLARTTSADSDETPRFVRRTSSPSSRGSQDLRRVVSL